MWPSASCHPACVSGLLAQRAAALRRGRRRDRRAVARRLAAGRGAAGCGPFLWRGGVAHAARRHHRSLLGLLHARPARDGVPQAAVLQGGDDGVQLLPGRLQRRLRCAAAARCALRRLHRLGQRASAGLAPRRALRAHRRHRLAALQQQGACRTLRGPAATRSSAPRSTCVPHKRRGARGCAGRGALLRRPRVSRREAHAARVAAAHCAVFPRQSAGSLHALFRACTKKC